MPLPRLYRLATSWMQGAAASRSGRKFLSEGKYNQGWFKRESIFLQKEDRLSFVPILIIVGVTKKFSARTRVSCPLHQCYIA